MFYNFALQNGQCHGGQVVSGLTLDKDTYPGQLDRTIERVEFADDVQLLIFPENRFSGRHNSFLAEPQYGRALEFGPKKSYLHRYRRWLVEKEKGLRVGIKYIYLYL